MERREGDSDGGLHIFCIYALADKRYYDELKRNFAGMERLPDWMEPRPGENIQQTINKAVQHANLILLLLSPDFFGDENRCMRAADQAMKEQRVRGVPVVPVILKTCQWEDTRYATLHPLPANKRPVTAWRDRGQAYQDVRNGLIHTLSKSRHWSLRGLPVSHWHEDRWMERQIFRELKSLLLEMRNAVGSNQAVGVIGLHGMGGFGKTTLALALCHDPEIKETFEHCILWSKLGDQLPDELDLLNSLLWSLEATSTRAITLEEARWRWQCALAGRVCLLVIDDVWPGSRGILNTLLEGGPRCVRLVTTRQREVIPSEAISMEVGELSLEESIDVLCKGLSEEKRQQADGATVERLVKQLRYWPLLLTLARSLLIDLVEAYQKTIGDTLQTLEQGYKDQGVVAFDRDEQTVRGCLETSLSYLAKLGELAGYSPVERYRELAIFPLGADIPLATLQKFWRRTGGLEEWKTEVLCMRLHKLSLLLTCKLDENGAIRLHHVMYDFLQGGANKQQQQQTHQNLLCAYAYQPWAQLPLDEPYLWWHLSRHLIGAGRSEEFVSTVKDGNYLAARIWVCNVYAVEADIDIAIAQAPDDTSLRLLKRNIALISHLLLRCASQDEIKSVLHSRLSPFPVLTKTCRDLESSASRPMLTSWHEFLDLSDSALKRTLDNHKRGVKGCAIDPKGAFIVSASADHTLKVWCAETGDEKTTLAGHTAEVNRCAVSPQGDFIVSASSDRTLRIWNLATGNTQGTLTGHADGVNGCAISSEGERVLSASDDGTLKIWHVATGSEEQTLPGHHGKVYSCAIIPAEQRILSAHSDATLQFWDLSGGSEPETLIGHAGRVNDCVVDSHGQHMVSASDDRTLRVWNARTGEELHILKGHTGKIFGCAISPGGERIVSASADWTLKIWDTYTGKELYTLKGHNGGVFGCAISSDGQWIVSASDDATLKTWYMDPDKEGGRTTESYGGEILDCAVSPSDSDVVVATSGATTLTVYSAKGGKKCSVNFDSIDGSVNGCAVSPDGTWTVFASGDRTLKIWDRQTGVVQRMVGEHEEGVNACVVSPDGTWIVSASDDTTLKIWDVKTREVVRVLKGHSDCVKACAVGPDGTWMVSASDDTTLKVWDVETGEVVRTLKGHTGLVMACAVSPDGTWIVSASSDMTLKVWYVETGEVVRTLKGHTGLVMACAVSPDGMWIVSASFDGTLKIWDAGDRQAEACRTTLVVGSRLQTCAFFSDSEHLVAGGKGGLYFLRILQ
jgi:WD40 repeat protein